MKKLGLAITSLFVSAIASAPATVAQIKPEKTNSTARDDQRISRAGVFDRYGHLPLSFEPNDGQSSSEVKFLAHGLGYGLFLTQDGAVLSLRDTRPDGANGKALFEGPVLPEAKELLRNTDAQAAMSASVLRMQVVGANPAASVVGSEELSGKSNYFIGNEQKKWRTNLSTYARVKYREIYPGVDLIYYGNQGRLEYDFVVAPGADPKRIRLAISRAAEEEAKESASKVQRSLRIDKNGDLVVATRVGQVRYQKPVAYQVGPHGGKRVIPARFEFKSKGEVGFALGAYDHAKDLVIDPTLVYSTYVAGATPGPYYFGYTGDQAAAIAVDSNGSAYITGLTASGDFPITPGAQQTVCKPYNNGCAGAPGQGFGTAVFVTKLSPDGSSLVYSTYIAGSSVGAGSITDSGSGIAVDSSGNAYIAGQTNSPDFPVTQGAYQTACGPRLDQINGYYCDGSHIISTCGPPGHGTNDGFVTKLNSAGSGLIYSTFLGGSLNDYLTGIAVNSAGEAYVSGFTLSSYSYSPGGAGVPAGVVPGLAIPISTRAPRTVIQSRLTVTFPGRFPRRRRNSNRGRLAHLAPLPPPRIAFSLIRLGTSPPRSFPS